MAKTRLLARLMKWSSGRRDMSIDSESLLEELAKSDYEPPKGDTERRWWEIPYLKGARFVSIVCIGILMLTFFLSYSIIYINDIILFENDLNINSQGAFNPHKSMNCEYGLYLFNTADLWANSGIQVSKGDRIKINISGAFNSSVESAKTSSQDNKELRYPWLYYNDVKELKVKEEDADALRYCVYRYDRLKEKSDKIRKKDFEVWRRDPRMAFGAALIGIFPESSDIHHNPLIDTREKAAAVWEWTRPQGKTFHKVKRNGMLYFAVNDMFDMKEFYEDTTHTNCDGDPFPPDGVAKLDRYPYHDYEDNLGQLMVAVEIQRHMPHAFFHPTMAYRFLEYGIDEKLRLSNDETVPCIWLKWLAPAVKGLWIAYYLLVFFIWIFLLFGLWSLVLVAVVYFLFIIGHQLHVVSQEIKPDRCWTWIKGLLKFSTAAEKDAEEKEKE